MNYPGFKFSRQCMKYKTMLDLDDYAIDTKIHEKKLLNPGSIFLSFTITAATL